MLYSLLTLNFVDLHGRSNMVAAILNCEPWRSVQNDASPILEGSVTVYKL